MRRAWLDRALSEGAFIDASERAPAFFKPEAVDEAIERYQHARAEMQRWA